MVTIFDVLGAQKITLYRSVRCMAVLLTILPLDLILNFCLLIIFTIMLKIKKAHEIWCILPLKNCPNYVLNHWKKWLKICQMYHNIDAQEVFGCLFFMIFLIYSYKLWFDTIFFQRVARDDVTSQKLKSKSRSHF